MMKFNIGVESKFYAIFPGLKPPEEVAEKDAAFEMGAGKGQQIA
jgi:hypothetical protein